MKTTKKMTKAFQLDSMSEPVEIMFHKKEKYWFPIDLVMDNEIFIHQQGWVKKNKLKTWKREVVQPLSSPFTAKDIQDVYKEYGHSVALGMIQGWGRRSLYHDNSCGLDYAKYEVRNMIRYGAQYDQFTDLIQDIGDKFISALLSKKTNKLLMKGKSLWHNYKNSNECGNLIGFVGVYEEIKLHPALHISHSIRGMFPLSPSFNSLDFDHLLRVLFVGMRKKEKIQEIVSVHDRIEYLTTKKIADSFEKIFEFEFDKQI